MRLDETGSVSSRADDLDEGLWFVVSRLDGTAVRDWRDLQRVKNEFAGPEREAAELFPAEARLVDTGNAYHLWVLPAGEHFPWGPRRRSVLGPRPGVAQRPLDAVA